MGELLGTLAIGFVAGILSGAFGIGGGVLMVPALRLVLGEEALVAVGSTLPVIIPSAITGASQYLRAGVADLRSGIRLGVCGVPFAILGAWLAEWAGGRIVMTALAVMVVAVAADTVWQAVRPRPAVEAAAEQPTLGWVRSALVGGSTGVYSGFLGLGGGFIMVPMLVRFGRFSTKQAIGTSLIAIVLLVLPSSITHFLLGNTDLAVVALLILGVVPGALVGSRAMLRVSDRKARIAFAVLLVATGAALVASETGLL